MGDVADDSGYYWGIDLPGLTFDTAARLASIIGADSANLGPILVDPAKFLTLHLDHDSVTALLRALRLLESTHVDPDVLGVASSLRETMDDWLRRAASDRDPDPS